MSVRPPCDAVSGWEDTSPRDTNNTGVELERRVCPNCRLYFDVGIESDMVFCSTACKNRHENGEYL